MGLITKIIVIALVIFALSWAYSNVKIDTLTICVKDNTNKLDVTCVEESDCAKYLTSLYGSYPDTPMYNFLLTETSSCVVGKCEVKEFSFNEKCGSSDTPIVYKVTAKEWMSVQ